DVVIFTLPTAPRSPLFPYTTLFRSRFPLDERGELHDVVDGRAPRLRRLAQRRAGLGLELVEERIHDPRRGRVGAEEIGVGEEERSEEHTSELQSLAYLVCRLLLEKK